MCKCAFSFVFCLCACVRASLCVRLCLCVCGCVLNQLLFWLRIKTDDRKCEAKGQIIGPY